MIIRGNTRGMFAKYADYPTVMANYNKLNAEIGLMVADVFKVNNAPLAMNSCQLSNVKPDQTVWEANNRQASAEAEVASINKVGDAMRNNPGYLKFKELETLNEIAKSGKVQNFSIIMNQSGKDVQYTTPVK